MILGIDIGSTMTKFALMDGNKLIYTDMIKSTQSYEDYMKKIDFGNLSAISIVGTGASFINDNIFGVPTVRVNEFKAAGTGGFYLSGLNKCIVVSLGTGTSFVYTDHKCKEHIGGTGMGGGLLEALSKMRGYKGNVDDFLELALKGELHNTDLQIRDISKYDIDDLYADVTAANLSKLTDDTSAADYAAGVCNLVFQNIGVMAVLADKPYNTGNIVIMGTLAQSRIAHECFDKVSKLFNCNFIMPENTAYGVAIGAALLIQNETQNE
ncbi:MAG: hypothetical protein K6E98_05255 [Lachnospiraceae bacterium]|nr:hypothetical protein [Lachnospiraceae bacterium]